MGGLSPGVRLFAPFLLASLATLAFGDSASFVNQWGTVTYTPTITFPSIYDHSFDIDGTHGLVFGGVEGGSLTDRAWTYDAVMRGLRALPSDSSTPSPRAGHASAAFNGVVYVVGGCATLSGQTCTSAHEDMFSFDLEAARWTAIDAMGQVPAPRTGASVVTWNDGTNDFLVLHGGDTYGVEDPGVFFFLVGENSFTARATDSQPSFDAGHSAVVSNNTMYVFGKVDSGQFEVWAFDLIEFSWTQVSTTGTAPSGRTGHVGLPLPGGFLVTGGESFGTARTDSFFLNIGTLAWSAVAAIPATRTRAAAAVDAGNVLVLGGVERYTPFTSVDTMYRYFAVPTTAAVSPQSGGNCGGTTVSVTGDRFANKGEAFFCRFGATEVPATRVSSTEMTCDSPQGPIGTAAVSVSVAGGLYSAGMAANASFTFYDDEPVPASSEAAAIAVATAGVQAALQVVAKTRCGTERRSGGDSVAVVLTGPEALPTNVTDHGTGRYGVTYMGTRAGTYSAAITMDGIPIAGSPYSITIRPGPPHLPASHVTPPAEGLSVMAGSETSLAVYAEDEFGNKITSVSGFTVIARKDGTPSVLGTLNVVDGGMVAKVAITTAGEWTITVQYRGTSGVLRIGQVTQTVTAGPVSAAASTPESASLQQGTSTVGVPQVVEIQPRDQYNNPVTRDGLSVTCQVKSGTGEVAVTGTVTQQGSRYVCTYVVERVGTYAVGILIGGTNIKGSPYPITVQTGDGMDPSNSLSYGEGLKGGVAGKTLSFFIQVRDQFGNNATKGGLVWEVGGTVVSSYAVEDLNDGSYSVTWTPKHLGHFGDEVVEVTHNGEHLMGSPFTVDIGYGWVFALIIILATIAGACIVGAIATFTCHKVRRRLRYMRLVRNPVEIFPPYDGDHEFEEDWAFQMDYEEGDLPPPPDSAGVDYQFDQITKDEVDPNWMHPTEQQDVHEYLNTTVRDFNRL